MIIDYGKLEEPIVEIEKVLSAYDSVEKKLILEHIFARFKKSRDEVHSKERMRTMLPGFVRKLIDEKEEEDGNF